MNYKNTMDDLWAKTISEPKEDAPTVISTFAGGGGSSIGYKAAGFNELAAVEWDEQVQEVFKRNFPGVPTFRDVSDFGTNELHAPERGLDVLDGSPPCQGFSLSGKREYGDSRNKLFIEFARLIDEYKPKVFVMENVHGMAKGRHKRLFEEVKRTLREAGDGYDLAVKLVHSDKLGVPQKRPRLIFIGNRINTKSDNLFPSPASVRVSSSQALMNMQNCDDRTLELNEKMKTVVARMEPGTDGGKVCEKNGKKKSYFSTARIDGAKPAPTIQSTQYEGGIGAVIHWAKDRPLTVGELKRLQSFPDQYDLTNAPYTLSKHIMGNSVPPLMMYEIAKQIKQYV